MFLLCSRVHSSISFRHIVVPATLVVAALANGCATQRPRVGVSDPAVFTLPHIAAAQRAYAEDTGAAGAAKDLSPFGHMQRYFASRATDWQQSRLRMDEMLDQTQQSESFASVLVQALDIKASRGQGATTPTANSAKPATDVTAIDTADAQALAAVLSVSPQDSPYDRVERARSFFTGYVLALLRLYGTDSRVLNVNALDPVAAVEANTEKVNCTAIAQAVTDAKVAIQTARALSEGRSDKADQRVVAARHEVETQLQSLTDSESNKRAQLDRCSNADAIVLSTFNDLITTRVAVTKAQDAVRAASEKGDFEKKAANQDLNVAAHHAADSQARYDAAVKDLGLHNATLSSRNKDVADKELALATARQTLNDLIWHDAREKARLAVASGAFTTEVPKRLILLIFQTHVEPGNKANQVVGLEAVITEPSDNTPQVVYVHPGRQYDTSDQRMLNRIQRAISVALATKAGVDATNIDADSRTREEVRGRYLSRVNKMASFASAGMSGVHQGGFGWYFYPSNVVVEKSLLGEYQAKGYLEAGARDCAVWLVVQKDIHTITLKLTPIYGSLDVGDYVADEGQSRMLTVPIPEHSVLENAVFTDESGVMEPSPLLSMGSTN